MKINETQNFSSFRAHLFSVQDITNVYRRI